MKRISFTLIAFSLFYYNLNAQEIKIGFKAGLNISNLKESGTNTTTKTGFHGGLFLENFINEKFAIQPEILYSSQGAKEEGKLPFLNQNVNATLSLDYINVPVMLKYYPIKNFSIEAGPQIGFLLSSKLDITSKYNSNITIDNSDLHALFNKFDYGLNFGLEYSSSGLFFSARYQHGLADIYNSTQNRVFQISTGYKF